MELRIYFIVYLIFR